ncbi:endonuclease III [Halogranum tailed virus 1]|uniref:Endonuclease III n=1 Tax=Halogranum tailed virus 1 TaxID=1273749 RepID=R4TH29_9CAUD|nr:endonuclease III [Halogranum tailed virus 1]AGM11591.1 endonuclease III [Halogranum tailed virus 1]
MGMDPITALHATNHFRRNRTHYRKVRNELLFTRKKFENSDMSVKVEMLQKSHAWAVLSVQTPVNVHEKAFRNLFANGLPLSVSEIRDSIKSCNYYKNKADYIMDSLQSGREWEKVANLLMSDELDKAHKFVLDNFKGVGPAKAPFVLAMLGFTEKMCIDTNVMQATGTERPTTVVVEKYEAAVDEIKSHFPTLVEETGSSFLFQWALFDYQRGDTSDHKVFFKEVAW